MIIKLVWIYGPSWWRSYSSCIYNYLCKSWLRSYSSCIYNYLCKDCLLMLKLWVWIPLKVRCTRYNIMWLSLSLTCDRSVLFSRYSWILPIKTTTHLWNMKLFLEHSNVDSLCCPMIKLSLRHSQISLPFESCDHLYIVVIGRISWTQGHAKVRHTLEEVSKLCHNTCEIMWFKYYPMVC